jgi:hypothetical protein
VNVSREIPPPDDLWPGIRSRIQSRRRTRRTVALFGAAAAVLLVVVAIRRPAGVEIAPIASATVRAVADSNDARVEREMLDELELRRGELRPETEADVRASLQTIDSAIVELRAELAKRPNDPALTELLAEAYAHKVDLMTLLANAS